MSTKTVSTGALLSVYTGMMLTETFGDVHEAMDVLMGEPLMTHQMASEDVAEQAAREAARQHPWLTEVDMDTFPDLDPVPRGERGPVCLAWVDRISEQHGREHRIESPPETCHVPFAEGLPAKFGGTNQ